MKLDSSYVREGQKDGGIGHGHTNITTSRSRLMTLDRQAWVHNNIHSIAIGLGLLAREVCSFLKTYR